MSSLGRPRVSRLVFLPALLLMALVGAANRCDAQGANHAGGNGGDAIRCVSAKPEIAIPACSNIIKDRREESENRAIALRNRASSYQQQGDLDHAIADYTTALKNPEPSGILAKIHLNRGLMYFRKNDEAEALADYNDAIAL